jgi:hypothetical protein
MEVQEQEPEERVEHPMAHHQQPDGMPHPIGLGGPGLVSRVQGLLSRVSGTGAESCRLS